jgi:hypothetical protein
MRRQLISGLGLAAAALAGCAYQHTPAPAAPVANYSWGLMHSSGEGEKLAYGEPNTDNVVVMMVCRPHSGVVQIVLPGRVAGAKPLRLASGGKTIRIIVLPPTGDEDVDLLHTDLKAGDPVLAGFAENGDLAILDAGGRTPLPVRPTERRLAGEFLAACKSPA